MPLNYRIRKPKIDNGKAPLLLLLHGYGSNEDDLFSFAEELPAHYLIVSAQAPHPMMYGSYAWYAINFDADANKFSDIPQAQASRDLIVDFIDYLTKKYEVATNDISLLGFSQGAILSFAVATSYPELIRRVVGLSGYWNPEIGKFSTPSEDVQKLQIFAAHGTDDQVIPVNWSRESIEKLNAFVPNLMYKEYPIGHGVNWAVFQDFSHWLQQTDI